MPAPLTDGFVKLLLLAIGGMVAARMAGKIVKRLVMHEMGRCCLAALEGFGPASYAISLLAAFAVLLAISLWQAERLGRGDVRTGIGDQPIAAKPLFLALWSALVVYLLIHFAVLFHSDSSWTRLPLRIHTGYLMFAFLPVVVLGPVCEEIYCRGWLWNALQRHCGPVTTGLIVSAIWIAAHLPFGFHRLLFLIPYAAVLAVSRHYCRSVRAPILLHITINAFALLGPPLYALLFSGPGPVLVPPL